MNAQLSLTAVCVLPGCCSPVATVGEPCPDCVQAFGDMLHRRPGAEPLTQAQIDARDEEIMAAYQAMNEQAGTRIEDTERRNQRCWICEERRTCTKQAAGWECPSCRDVI